MHDTTDVDRTAPEVAAPPSPPPRRARRRLVAGTALVVLLAAVAVPAVRWWTGPHVFQEGYDVRLGARPVDRAATAVLVAEPRDLAGRGAVTVRSLDAHLAADSAGSTVTFSVCRRTDTTLVVGVEPEHLDRLCHDVQPFTPGTVVSDADGFPDTLVMTVTPSGPGATQVDHVTLSYSMDAGHGWRRGTDDEQTRVRVVAR